MSEREEAEREEAEEMMMELISSPVDLDRDQEEAEGREPEEMMMERPVDLDRDQEVAERREAEEMMMELISPPVDLDRDQEEAEGRELQKLNMMLLRSPVEVDGSLYFQLPPSPQSPGLSLSPPRNFYEDNYHVYTGGIHVMTSPTNGLPRIDFPRSPGDPVVSQSLAANHVTRYRRPLLQCPRYRALLEWCTFSMSLLTMTLWKINYASELDGFCEALERWWHFCQNVIRKIWEEKRAVEETKDILLYSIGLRYCFAVPICDNQTGKEIYILEFFLPPLSAHYGYQQKLLDFLSATINQSSPNLRMAHKQFSREGAIEGNHFHVNIKPAVYPEYLQRQKTIKPSKCGCKNSPTFETSRCLYVQDMNLYVQPGNWGVASIYRKIKMDEGERSLRITISEKEYKQRVEALERLYGKQLYGKSLQEAADCLGVSRSTMKRMCRAHGIPRWRSYKRKVRERFSLEQTHKNELLQGSDGAVSYNSQNLYPDSARAPLGTHLRELLTENTSFTITNSQTQSAKRQKSQCSRELPSIVEPRLENTVSTIDVPTPKLSNSSAIQGERTAFINIKATYGEQIMKFSLHYPSALVDLEKEVQKRVGLQPGTFTLKYWDEECDWVGIFCDEDLKHLLEEFLKKGKIRMLVEDINHCKQK